MNFAKSGILLENPFRDAFENVCLELLQLMLVVERVKASREGYKALGKLVELRCFLKKQKSIEGFFQRYPFSKQPSEADQIFSHVCTLLDEKHNPSLEDFIRAMWSHLDDQKGKLKGIRAEMALERVTEFCRDIAPELIKKSGYDFRGFGTFSLGYPHHMIVTAYIEYERIFKVIDNFQEICEQSIINSVLEQYANQLNIESKSLLENSEKSILVRFQINQRIFKKFSSVFFDIVKPIRELLGNDIVPSELFYYTVSVENEEFKQFNFEAKVCEVVKMKIPKETFNHAKNNGTEDLLNRAILNRIWQAAEAKSDFANIRDDSYYVDALSQYSYWAWASCKNHSLVNIEVSKGRKLSINSILRGLKFSYWLESERSSHNGTLKIIDAANLYVNKFGVVQKALTVKFAFEAIKKIGKVHLSGMILNQLLWRCSNDFPSIVYVFCPLNDIFYKKFNLVYNTLKKYSEESLKIESFKDLLNYIESFEDHMECDDVGGSFSKKEFRKILFKYKESIELVG